MIKLPRDYAFAVIFAALSGLMLLVALGEWLHFRHARSEISERLALKPTATAEPTQAGGDLTKTPELEAYAEMVERPLFVQNRRPPTEEPEEEAPAAPAEPKTPLNAKLMGVILTPAGKTALLVDAQNKYKRARKGTVIDGWKLVEIKDDRVSLEQGGEQKDLMLIKPKPKTNAPPAPKPTGKATVKGPGQAPPDDEDMGEESGEEDSDATEDEDTQTDDASDEEE